MERHSAEVDGTLVSWLAAPGEGTPVLYVHGVPDSAVLWAPFLERTGGIAVDLPGFGESGKPASWPYSLDGYARFLPAFLDRLEIDRVRLVVHDWGSVALTLGERVERVVAIDVLPMLPGHRWHWIARAWRTPVVGELGMGFTGRTLLRRLGGLTPDHVQDVLQHFDHGTQRAILKLYRSASTNLVSLGAVAAPALVLWGEHDRYLDSAWARRFAAALGGPAEVEIVPGAGHWPWLEHSPVIDKSADFLRAVS